MKLYYRYIKGKSRFQAMLKHAKDFYTTCSWIIIPNSGPTPNSLLNIAA